MTAAFDTDCWDCFEKHFYCCKIVCSEGPGCDAVVWESLWLQEHLWPLTSQSHMKRLQWSEHSSSREHLVFLVILIIRWEQDVQFCLLESGWGWERSSPCRTELCSQSQHKAELVLPAGHQGCSWSEHAELLLNFTWAPINTFICSNRNEKTFLLFSYFNSLLPELCVFVGSV